MGDSNFANLIDQQRWRTAIIVGASRQKAERKYAECLQFVNEVDGIPGAQNASILPLVPAAAPQQRTERLDSVPTSRMKELTPATAAYIQFVRKYMWRDMEFESLVLSGQLYQIPDTCFAAIYGHLRGAIETKLAGANVQGTLAVPGIAGLEAFAATHTLADATTYKNYASLALSLANLKTAMSGFSQEKDIAGNYTAAEARFLIASDFSTLYQATRSKVLSADQDANPGELLTQIQLPGMSTTAVLASGPTVGGLTIEFRQSLVEGWTGRPYVTDPYVDEDGRVCVRYGCDYALLAGQWAGLYFMNSGW